MIVIGVAVLGLGIIQAICVLALVDQYKGLLQIRRALLLADTPYDLDIGGGAAQLPSAAGLPARLDKDDLSIVVVFSTKCATCITVAHEMAGRLPTQAWAVITGGSEE